MAGVDVNLDSKIDAADYTVWRDNRDAQLALGSLMAVGPTSGGALAPGFGRPNRG